MTMKKSYGELILALSSGARMGGFVLNTSLHNSSRMIDPWWSKLVLRSYIMPIRGQVV